MSRAADPVALVTGGGRRIGAAIARRLAAAGFRVIVTYRDSRSAAETLARRIGGRAWRLDLARPETFSRFAGRVGGEFGRLDLLVHNAAVFPRTPAGRVSARDFDAVFAVNLRAPVLLTGKLLPLLRRSSGRPAVVLIGDAGAGRLWPSYLPYCLSKIALERLGRAWRKALAPGIRVGVVRPGLALRPPGFSQKAWGALRARRGGGRLDSPEKIAAAVLRFFRRGGYNCNSEPPGGDRMAKWRCIVCGYVYDPAAGDPDGGVDPGTPFESIPDDWVCPLCGVSKDQFEMVEE